MKIREDLRKRDIANMEQVESAKEGRELFKAGMSIIQAVGVKSSIPSFYQMERSPEVTEAFNQCKKSKDLKMYAMSK